jgi:hypothetical protein
MPYDDPMRRDDRIFRELLDDHVRTTNDKRLLLDTAWQEHYDFHDGVIRYCDHPLCRLVAQQRVA